jgi:hypothetical protein
LYRPDRSFTGAKRRNARAPVHTVPYGTGLLGWRCPRHFVPGYDHTVPPGQTGPVGRTPIVTWHEMPLQFGHLPKITSGNLRPEGAGGLSPGFQPWEPPLVPEGRCDRSLARSAWENGPRKNRPLGYGMIGRLSGWREIPKLSEREFWGDVVGRGRAQNPGSDGASSDPDLCPTCAGGWPPSRREPTYFSGQPIMMLGRPTTSSHQTAGWQSAPWRYTNT